MTRKFSKTDVEHIKGNGKSYFYLYPIGDIVQGSLHRGFHVCTDQGNFHKSFHVCTNQGSFLRNFLTNSELGVN
jgi:hypothetical protein